MNGFQNQVGVWRPEAGESHSRLGNKVTVIDQRENGGCGGQGLSFTAQQLEVEEKVARAETEGLLAPPRDPVLQNSNSCGLHCTKSVTPRFFFL